MLALKVVGTLVLMGAIADWRIGGVKTETPNFICFIILMAAIWWR